MVTNEEWIDEKKEQILNDIRRRMPERYPEFGLEKRENQETGSFAWDWKQLRDPKFEDLEKTRRLTWYISTRIYYRPDPTQTVIENKFTKYVKEQLKREVPPVVPPVIPPIIFTPVEIARAKADIKRYEDVIARLPWMREDFTKKINEIKTKYGIE
jgi:hypothetical protein